MSRWSEDVASTARPSYRCIVVATAFSDMSAPRARATATISFSAASAIARVSGTSLQAPTAARVTAPIPLSGAMKRNLVHIE